MSYEQLAASVDALAEANRSLTEQSLETQAGSIAASDNATAKALEAAQAALSAEDSARVATDAANIAKDSTDIMESTAAGIATGKPYFYTVSPESSQVLILWKNNDGVAEDTGKRTPSSSAVTGLRSETAAGRLSINLVNTSDSEVLLNTRPNNTTGNPLVAPGYNTTGFIPVVAGETYYLSSRDYLAWYNASKVFISGSNNSITGLTALAPANAAFMRASAKTSAPNLWSGFQIQKGGPVTVYEKYGRLLTKDALQIGGIVGDNIAQNTIPLAATEFLVPSKNMYNDAAAVAGFIDGTTGTLTDSPTYRTSSFIRVVPGKTYFGAGPNPIRFCCYYDSNKNFVVGGVNTSNSTLTPPATAAYVRISISTTDRASFQLEEGTAATAFVAYGYTLKDPTGAPIGVSLADLSVKTSLIADSAVTQPKTDFLKTGKNLFNVASATIGQFVNPTTGSMAPSASFDTTSLIRVTPGVAYKTSAGIRFSCYFSSNGTSVIAGGINDNTTSITTFTPPAGTVFVRISFGHANLALFQLEVGTVSTAYEQFGWKIEGPNGETLIGVGGTVTSTWSGKSWASLGDSITQQAKWQAGVVGKHGLLWTNFGKGGTKISGAPGDLDAMCQDARIDAIPTTTDLVSVMGGTNDWAQNVPMGEESSTDPLTFNGALNTMITKLMARFPDKRVILCTTPYGEMPGRAGWDNGWTNTQGLTTRDYAEAVRKCCKRWTLPVIDVNTDAGWNTLNIRTYITDDGGLLHPNDVGGSRIASVVVAGFNKIAPIV